MKFRARHPKLSTLALLAGGDVPVWEFLAERWHARSCPQCKRQLEEFRSARKELKLISGEDMRQLSDGQPGEGDAAWTALEAEMRANIRLGLIAGSLAPGVSERESRVSSHRVYADWRWAAVCGALVFVMTAGWWLRSPNGEPQPVASAPAWEAPVAEPAGIQMLVPAADVSRTEADFDGSTRSTVIDRETGQVTLQQVYVE